MKQRRRRESAQLLRGQAKLPTDRKRDAANALRVPGGVRVARLDGCIERLDRLEQRRLELAGGIDEIVRALCEILVLSTQSGRGAADEQREDDPEDPKTTPTAYQTVFWSRR